MYTHIKNFILVYLTYFILPYIGCSRSTEFRTKISTWDRRRDLKMWQIKDDWSYFIMNIYIYYFLLYLVWYLSSLNDWTSRHRVSVEGYKIFVARVCPPCSNDSIHTEACPNPRLNLVGLEQISVLQIRRHFVPRGGKVSSTTRGVDYVCIHLRARVHDFFAQSRVSKWLAMQISLLAIKPTWAGVLTLSRESSTRPTRDATRRGGPSPVFENARWMFLRISIHYRILLLYSNYMSGCFIE